MAFKGVGKAVSKGVPFTFAWSRDGVTTDVTINDTDNKAMGFDYTHDVSSTDHRDGTSAVFAVTFDEPVHQIAIRTVPVGTTGGTNPNTPAQARTNAVAPDIGTYVTLAGGPAFFNGTWLYKGGASVSYTPDGVTEVSMTLYRHGFDVEAATSFATVQNL
jgi:hypothetical protein